MTDVQDSDQDTLKRATRVFGEEAQMMQMQEECLELYDALEDFAVGEAEESEVIDEIADVGVMVEQMKLLFGEDAVEERIQFKMNRLENRLDAAESKQERGSA